MRFSFVSLHTKNEEPGGWFYAGCFLGGPFGVKKGFFPAAAAASTAREDEGAFKKAVVRWLSLG